MKRNLVQRYALLDNFRNSEFLTNPNAVKSGEIQCELSDAIKFSLNVEHQILPERRQRQKS